MNRRARAALLSLLAGAFLLAGPAASAAATPPAATPATFTISGFARNESAEGLPGVRVSFCTSPTTCGSQVTTAADGSYHSGPLAPGAYRVLFVDSAAVYASGYSRPLNATDRWVDARAVTLGPSRTGINGNMLPGTVFYGTVTGPTGAALPGASITACGFAGELCGSAQSAADGRYRALVGEGIFTLRVAATIGTDKISGWIGAFGLTFNSVRAVRLTAAPGMQHAASVQITRAPRTSFIVGTQLSSAGAEPSVPMRIAWATAPTASYVLDERRDVGPTRAIAAVSGATFGGSTIASLDATHAYRFDVKSGGGRWLGPTSDLLLVQDDSSQVTYGGTWTSVTNASRSGGSARASASISATAAFTFTGRSVAWVSRTGPGTGNAQVFLDDHFAGTIDLSASKAAVRTIVFARSWPAAGTHTLLITESGIVSHPPVEVDAFLVGN